MRSLHKGIGWIIVIIWSAISNIEPGPDMKIISDFIVYIHANGLETGILLKSIHILVQVIIQLFNYHPANGQPGTDLVIPFCENKDAVESVPHRTG